MYFKCVQSDFWQKENAVLREKKKKKKKTTTTRTTRTCTRKRTNTRRRKGKLEGRKGKKVTHSMGSWLCAKQPEESYVEFHNTLNLSLIHI